MKQISKALLEAQKEMGNAIKDSTNPFFKNKYADLNSIREACMPSLNKHGIVLLQPIVHIDGKNFVKTLLLHESGESLESLTEIIYSKDKDAQAQGSGITYARRYGMQSFVNVGADDDDGNSASTPTNVKTGKYYQDIKNAINDCKTVSDLEALYNSIDKSDRDFLKTNFASKGELLKKSIN